MKKIVIEGNNQLSGTIKISGAKNSVVALIPAAILCNGKVEFSNVPDISDIYALEETVTYFIDYKNNIVLNKNEEIHIIGRFNDDVVNIIKENKKQLKFEQKEKCKKKR